MQYHLEEPIIQISSRYNSQHTYVQLAEMLTKNFDCAVISDIPDAYQDDPDDDMRYWLLIDSQSRHFKAELKGLFSENHWDTPPNKRFWDVYRGNLKPLDKNHIHQLTKQFWA